MLQGNTLYSVAYGNGVFVAVGDSGTTATSVNGTDWTMFSTGIVHPLSGVAFGNDRFVAVGYRGTTITSSDAVSWSKTVFDSSRSFFSVVYGDSQFVAVGDSGSIIYSRNGSLWTRAASGVIVNLSGIIFGQGRFVAVGDSGTALFSDGDIGGSTLLQSFTRRSAPNGIWVYRINAELRIVFPILDTRQLFATEIFNCNGRKIYSAVIAPANGVFTIHTTRFPPGFYFAAVTDRAHRTVTSGLILTK